MAYTTIDDPSAFFQTVIWTGNGASDTRTISFDGNSDMQPDWVWHKQRNDTYGNHVFDSSRGFGANKELITRGRFVEGDTSNFNTGANGYVNAAASNGFVVKKGTNSSNGNRYINESNDTHVAWCWKANGGTATATISESGNNPAAVVQANATAGFSIISYTGTGASGTMAHGLGAIPEMYWIKNRDSTSNFEVFTSVITSGENSVLRIDNSDAKADSGVTLPTSSVITVTQGINQNQDGQKYIMYCFKSIQGYSKIGSYVGNANANGTFVYTGFKPAFVIIKKSSGGENWKMVDTKRSPFNVMDEVLEPSTSNAESSNQGGGDSIDFGSNGFKCRDGAGQFNDANTYIYYAIAENPFVSSEGVPTTAR